MTDDQLQQLLTDVQYLKDRQAILDVVMRHARGHDRHDAELMNSCFWDDGVDEHGQFVTPGPEYGNWANKVHTAGYFLHMHNITNHTCEIDGDTAHCETYVIGALLPRSAPGRAKFVSGRYLDRLERRDGEWRILVRRTTIEVEVEGDSKWPENEISRPSPRARGTPPTCPTRARCGLTHALFSGTARPAEAANARVPSLDSVLERVADQLRLVVQLELGQGVADMVLHRAGGQGEARGDLRIGQALGDQPQYLRFAVGQPRDERPDLACPARRPGRM